MVATKNNILIAPLCRCSRSYFSLELRGQSVTAAQDVSEETTSCSWVCVFHCNFPLYLLHQAGRGLALTCCNWWVLALLAWSGASGLANAQQRGLLEANSNKVLRASLMHRDHVESPLSVPGTTIEARYHAIVARENARMVRRGLATTAVEFNTSIVSAVAEGEYEYVLTLYLGTPVQKFFLIMDTGSDLVWVQCFPCIQCYNETNPFFDPSKSSTYLVVSCNSSSCNQTQLENLTFCNSLDTCEIHYAYGQAGSEYGGVLSTETISFNTDSSESVPDILFGCMNNNTNSFGRVDGLVGFGRGFFSLSSQLSALNSTNVFSYCLIPYNVSTTLTSSLIFGIPDTANDLQLVYTPILNNGPTFYWVNLTSISINGVDINVSTTSLEFNSSSNSGGTFFDSGTTYIVFNEDIYSIVTQNLQDLITYPMAQVSDNICYNTSGVQDITYPNMTLHFSSLDGTSIVDFELTRQNLFISSEVDLDCLTIISGTNIHSNIIGNVAQADHYVEIDVENMKIGWIDRDCSLPM